MMIAVLCSTSLDCFTLPPPPVGKRDAGDVGQEVAPSNFVFVDNRAFRTNCRRRADGDDFVTEKGGRKGESHLEEGRTERWVPIEIHILCKPRVSSKKPQR